MGWRAIVLVDVCFTLLLSLLIGNVPFKLNKYVACKNERIGERDEARGLIVRYV